ncbi:hypothetical protein [Rossellomorea aquimaris]|nr:hypothetical protein [Rossellomorea aquimaris]
MGEPIVRNGTISLLEYIEYGRQTSIAILGFKPDVTTNSVKL